MAVRAPRPELSATRPCQRSSELGLDACRRWLADRRRRSKRGRHRAAPRRIATRSSRAVARRRTSRRSGCGEPQLDGRTPRAHRAPEPRSPPAGTQQAAFHGARDPSGRFVQYRYRSVWIQINSLLRYHYATRANAREGIRTLIPSDYGTPRDPSAGHDRVSTSVYPAAQ